MIKVFLITSSLATLQLFSIVNDFQTTLPQPVCIKEEIQITKTRYALEALGAPSERMNSLVRGTYAASIGTDIDPILIATIIPVESNFNINAKSKLGYKGLMQTPKADMKWTYAESDIMRGACTLREKIVSTKGNLDLAMVKYKGHGGPESVVFAKSQMSKYRKIKTLVNERIKLEVINERKLNANNS